MGRIKCGGGGGGGDDDDELDPLVEALDILTYDLFNGEQHGLKLMEKRG